MSNSSKLNQKSISSSSGTMLSEEVNEAIYNLRNRDIVENTVLSENNSDLINSNSNNDNIINMTTIMSMFKTAEEARKKTEEEISLLKIKLEKYQNFENNNKSNILNNNLLNKESNADFDMSDPFQKLALTSKLLHHLSPHSKIENFEKSTLNKENIFKNEKSSKIPSFFIPKQYMNNDTASKYEEDEHKNYVNIEDEDEIRKEENKFLNNEKIIYEDEENAYIILLSIF